MNFSNDEAGYLAELARGPAARVPATLGEIWNSEWKRGALDTVGGTAAPYAEAADELTKAIEGETGQPIADYATSKGVKLYGATAIDFDADRLRDLARTLPDTSQKKIEPLIDIRLNAARKAQKIEADAADVAGATYGLSGVAVAFMAGIARQSVDPVNLAAMVATAPLGGEGGAGLAAAARVIGREAAANAAAQAAVEPIIEPARASLGLESGFGRAVGNVVEAGIGGGILGGLFHGVGRGLHALRGERPAEGAITPPAPETRTGESGIVPESVPDPTPAGPLAPARPAEQFAPDDFHAVGDLAMRDHVVDAMSPIDTPAGRLEHAAKVADAAARIESVERPVMAPPDIDAPAMPKEGRFADLPVERADPLPADVKSEQPAQVEPAKPSSEAAAEKPIGDMVLHQEAQRVLAERGDFDIHLEGPDGQMRRVKASEALRQVQDDHVASQELLSCIGAAAGDGL